MQRKRHQQEVIARAPVHFHTYTMLSLGIDPDTTDTAFAWWEKDGPVSAHVAHVVRKKGVTGADILIHTAHEIRRAATYHRSSTLKWPVVVAVEGQQIDGRKAKPASLFQLAQVAGMCISHVQERYQRDDLTLYIPTPTEWKGQVPKHAHQARLYDDLGWGYEVIGGRKGSTQKGSYARPLDPPKEFNHIKAGQWKHVGDALALAKWAYEQGPK